MRIIHRLFVNSSGTLVLQTYHIEGIFAIPVLSLLNPSPATIHNKIKI